MERLKKNLVITSNLSDSRIDFRFSHLSITLIMEKWNLGTGKFIFSNTLIKTRVLVVFSRQGLKTVGFDSDPLRCTGGT